MHLYGDILDAYAERDLEPRTLRALDVHISNCLFCAHTLADIRAAETRWERRGWLGRLVRLDDLEPAHLVEDVRAEAA